MVAGIGGELPGRLLRSTDPLVEIESECSEEPHPVWEASVGCDFEFVAEKLFGFGESITEALVPRSVRGGSEPELDQEFEVAGIVLRCSGETVVVEGLAVVRVSPRFEQCPSEVCRRRVWWLIGLTATERPGQRRERWDETSPEEPGVRIGAGTEKKLGRDERGAMVVGGVDP